MSLENPTLSKEQWDFLSLFDALDQPLPIRIAGELVPLAPGPFLDLLRLTREYGWIEETGPDTFRLAANLPDPVKKRLRKINSPKRLARILKKLEQGGLHASLSSKTWATLMNRSGQRSNSAEREYDLAREALDEDRYEEASRHLENILKGSSDPESTSEAESQQVRAAMELSDLRLRMGKKLGEVPTILHQAKGTAIRLGDRRSRALIDLRLGRFSYVSDKLTDALDALSSGLDEVENLGDEDIFAQSSEFAGLYYFLQGMHKDAIKYYDRAMAARHGQMKSIVDFFLPLTFGFCAAYLGQFQRAIGVLEFNRRLLVQKKESALAALFEAALGIVLLIMGNKKDAHTHLRAAEETSRLHRNDQAWLLARIGLAHLHFLEGRPEQSANLMLESVQEASRADHVIRQYIFPFILEDIFTFWRMPSKPSIDFGFEQEMDRIIHGPNIHLRGVAYRLQAKQSFEGYGEIAQVRSDLETSLRYLRRSGDPVEQAKTLVLMAQVELRSGDLKKSAELAREAWPYLSSQGEIYFPPDLKPLLDAPSKGPGKIAPSDLSDRLLDMLEELVPSTERDEVLTRMVIVSSRFHHAERGGLFWFSGDQTEKTPHLQASFNLSAEEAASEEFKPNLALILRSFRQNQPLLSPGAKDKDYSSSSKSKAALCLPIEVRGRVKGVLYHDNAFSNDPFDYDDKNTLQKVARQMGVYVERIWEYSRLIENRTRAFSAQSIPSEDQASDNLIGQSKTLIRLLDQADQVAQSEASVLVLGETGVGKELVAGRIHRKSLRSDGPFIIVDLSAISENLVESELFGHEKGAFTGADRQKPGRIELAHGGTIFLDEVGEIPLGVQTKLLRTLQEKTFVRVGGTKTLHSDFRLVAATNRDLETEVAEGRFREDLYYRLNVIPLTVPPLRQRGEDVLLLARYFLRHYERKHHRPNLEISPEDEERLTKYPWPGNVRELKNVIERAVLVSNPDRLEFLLPSLSGPVPSGDLYADTPTMDELERRYIRYVLDKTKGRIAGPNGAAALLGLKRSTLYTRMKKLGMSG